MCSIELGLHDTRVVDLGHQFTPLLPELWSFLMVTFRESKEKVLERTLVIPFGIPLPQELKNLVWVLGVSLDSRDVDLPACCGHRRVFFDLLDKGIDVGGFAINRDLQNAGSATTSKSRNSSREIFARRLKSWRQNHRLEFRLREGGDFCLALERGRRKFVLLIIGRIFRWLCLVLVVGRIVGLLCTFKGIIRIVGSGLKVFFVDGSFESLQTC